MSVSFNKRSTAIVAVAVIAATLGLGSALGATPPAGMSAQEYKAQVIRSKALNDLYGGREIPGQYKAMVRAERIRGEAMNRLATSGVFTAPAVASYTVAGSASGERFDWTDFAIGLGAMFSLVVLAGALAGATLNARRGHAGAHAA